MNSSLFITKCCSINNAFQESLLFQKDDGGMPDSDVIISELMAYLKKAFKYNICKWDPSNMFYPKHMLLGGDKGILAYIVFSYHEGNAFNKNALNIPLAEIVRMVSYAESRLDRPIFFINLLNYKDFSGLYFETSEQIKDRLYNDDDCVVREKDIYIPDITQMGDFANLNIIWNDLKRTMFINHKNIGAFMTV